MLPPDVDPADPKEAREIQKLDLEIAKLKSDVAESQRPYLWRNPQVIPTAIATLAAVIGLGLGLYFNYFNILREKADLDQKLANVSKDQADQKRADADKARKSADLALQEAKKAQLVADQKRADADKATKSADLALQEAKKAQLVADQTMKDAKDTKAKADRMVATEEGKIQDANRRSDIAAAQADRAEQLNRDFRRYVHEMNKDRFKITRLPDFIYDQQDQLHHLGLINMISNGGYDWLVAPVLVRIEMFRSATPTSLERSRPWLILWNTRKIAPANSAAFLTIICLSTSGSMNRKPSWQMFAIGLCATTPKASFWQSGCLAQPFGTATVKMCLSDTSGSSTFARTSGAYPVSRTGPRQSGCKGGCTDRS